MGLPIYMFKYANATLINSTADGVISCVKEKIKSEVSSFPKIVQIDVKVKPLSFEKKDRENNDSAQPSIDDATGEATITFKNYNIILPFMIKNGELCPFETIKINKESTFYSRETLMKLLLAIDNEKQDDDLGFSSAFSGVDKARNISTDRGFLDSALKIQQTQGRGSSTATDGTNRYITASNIDNLLEKVASIKVVTKEELQSIEANLFKKIADVTIEQAEKLASVDLSEDEKNEIQNKVDQINNVKKADIIDITKLRNGSFAKLIEKKDENSYCLTTVLVYHPKDIKTPYYATTSNMYLTKTLLIDARGRYLEIINGCEVLGCKTQETFNLEKITLKELAINNTYVYYDGETVTIPFEIERDLSQQSDEDKIRGLNAFDFKRYDIRFSNSKYGNLVDLPGTKFEKYTREEAIKKFAQNMIGTMKNTIMSWMPVDMIGVDGADRNFVLLRDKIAGFVSNRKELLDIEDHTGGATLFKAAGYNSDKIVLLFDPKEGNFTIIVKNGDFGNKDKEFAKLSEMEVANRLKAFGVPFSSISTVVAKAKTVGHAMTNLPGKAEVVGGKQVNSKVKGLLDRLGDVQTSKEILEQIATETLGSSLKKITGNAFRTAISTVAKFADEDIHFEKIATDKLDLQKEFAKKAEESAFLSAAFEKIAIEKQDGRCLDIAKILSAKSDIESQMMNSFSSNNSLVGFMETMASIKDCEDSMSKLATDLTQLEIMQNVTDNVIIDNEVIRGAISNIDGLYRMANIASNS